MAAKVEEIYIGAEPGKRLESVDEVIVIEMLGIDGDRYALKQGTFTKPEEEGDAGKHVTLIESEAIEAALEEFGDDFRDGKSRRNIVTRGIRLNDLINHRLQIGDVILKGERHCHPCGHLAKLTATDARKSLKMRGGLRTTVLKGGVIHVGDRIRILEGNRDR